MTWLPMNQTRLEKYGTAVLLWMYSNMAGSLTGEEKRKVMVDRYVTSHPRVFPPLRVD